MIVSIFKTLVIEMLLFQGREYSIGTAAAILAALGIAGALVPPWIVFAQRSQFEVASVKLNTNDSVMEIKPQRSGDRISMHNTQVYSMIFYAYHLTQNYQLVGYPDLPAGFRWWDMEARIGRDATDDEVRLMMQSLLEDRFKLKVHRENREMAEYELTGGQVRLQASTDAPMKLTIEGRTFTQPPGTCGTSLWLEGAHLVCHAVTTEKIAAEASAAMAGPAVDRTGLTGTYDLNVLYMTDRQKLPEDTVPAPSFQQAFPAETGIKLVKGKGPVEVLVVDHLEKASENQ